MSAANPLTLGALAEHLGADLVTQIVGDPDQVITGLGSLSSAQSGEITHLSSPSYKDQLGVTQASVVILQEKYLEDCPCAALVTDQPYLVFAKVSQLFAKPGPGATGIHPSAVVSDSAIIAASAYVGPNVVIEADVRVLDDAVIYGNAYIGPRTKLAAGVIIHANATLQADVVVGERSVIHSGAVIGASGFGFTPGPDGVMQEIAQIGGVRIGADVSIGANTTIDCGAIDDTVIEDGVKIDNQVQIGHNSHIGAHTLICGCVGIVGSTKIGRHCVLAGGAGVGGEKPIELCDGVILSATTHVTASITEPGVYSGSSLYQPHNQWRRNIMRQSHLDELFKRVKRLEKQANDPNS